MTNLKLAPGVEIAMLKRRIKTLEHLLEASEHRVEELHRDRIQANMQAVYRATMSWYRWFKAVSASGPIGQREARMFNACARAEKINTGRGGRGK